MKVKIYSYNIWDNPVHSIDIDHRYSLVPVDDENMNIFADVPDDTTVVEFKVNGSDERALIYNPRKHLTLPKSKNGHAIIQSDNCYDLDKPVLFSDKNMVNWSAVEQFDLLRFKKKVYEVLRVRKNISELQDFSNWERIPPNHAVLTLTTEIQR